MQIYLDWFILMNSMHTYYIIHDTDNQKVLCSAWDNLSERKGWSVWKRRRKGLHIPKILRIKILLLKWSWVLVRYACFEMGKTLFFMKRKVDRQQFRKMINSYRIFNPNVLLVFLLLLPFSLRKTVYHDHHQEL